jgi:hypothetical protein
VVRSRVASEETSQVGGTHWNQMTVMSVLLLLFTITLGGQAVAQFREVPLPFADTTCLRLQFIDENHGWVAGMTGTIFHTTDGGLTWNTYASPYPTGAITEIRFSTKDYGILWANPDPNAYTGRLYQTFNAGRDWALVPMPDDSLFIFLQWGSNDKLGRFDVYPLTPRHIAFFAVREWRNKPNTAPLQEEFYAWTTNGGQDWQTNTLSPGVRLSNLIALDTNRWGRFVGSENAPQLPICAFDVSVDHGLTWTQRRSWIPVVAGFCEFWDSKRGMIFGATWEPEPFVRVDSGSYVTTDGGDTWTRWGSVVGAFTAVFFSDSLIYVVGNGRYHQWDPRLHGTLIRKTSPWPGSQVILLERTVTAVCAVGKKLYALLLDGRLLVLDDATLAAEPPPHTPDMPVFTASPNPAHDNVTLTRIGGSTRAPLVFEVYDMTGRRVLASSDLQIPADAAARTFSVSTLPSGAYRIVPLAHPAAAQTITIVR